jgi:hypothetical protein
MLKLHKLTAMFVRIRHFMSSGFPLKVITEVSCTRYTPWRYKGGVEVWLLLILNLSTRLGWVVSVTPRPRFTHWIRGWVGPRAGLDAGTRRKILCPCRGSNPDRPARSQTLSELKRNYWSTILIIVRHVIMKWCGTKHYTELSWTVFSCYHS